METLISLALRSLRIAGLVSPIEDIDSLLLGVLRGIRLGRWRGFESGVMQLLLFVRGGSLSYELSPGWETQSSDSESSHACAMAGDVGGQKGRRYRGGDDAMKCSASMAASTLMAGCFDQLMLECLISDVGAMKPMRQPWSACRDLRGREFLKTCKNNKESRQRSGKAQTMAAVWCGVIRLVMAIGTRDGGSRWSDRCLALA